MYHRISGSAVIAAINAEMFGMRESIEAWFQTIATLVASSHASAGDPSRVSCEHLDIAAKQLDSPCTSPGQSRTLDPFRTPATTPISRTEKASLQGSPPCRIDSAHSVASSATTSTKPPNVSSVE